MSTLKLASRYGYVTGRQTPLSEQFDQHQWRVAFAARASHRWREAKQEELHAVPLAHARLTVNDTWRPPTEQARAIGLQPDCNPPAG
jgi:hypothetical protein